MEGGAVGFDGNGLLNLSQSSRQVVFRNSSGGEERVGICIVGIDGENSVRLLDATIGLASSDHEGSEVDARRDVGGLELNSAREFGVGGHRGTDLEVRPAELIMSFGKVTVDLEGIRELDAGFLVFAALHIALAALEVLLLLNVYGSRWHPREQNQVQVKQSVWRKP